MIRLKAVLTACCSGGRAVTGNRTQWALHVCRPQLPSIPRNPSASVTPTVVESFTPDCWHCSPAHGLSVPLFLHAFTAIFTWELTAEPFDLLGAGLWATHATSALHTSYFFFFLVPQVNEKGNLYSQWEAILHFEGCCLCRWLTIGIVALLSGPARNPPSQPSLEQAHNSHKQCVKLLSVHTEG